MPFPPSKIFPGWPLLGRGPTLAMYFIDPSFLDPTLTDGMSPAAVLYTNYGQFQDPSGFNVGSNSEVLTDSCMPMNGRVLGPLWMPLRWGLSRGAIILDPGGREET